MPRNITKALLGLLCASTLASCATRGVQAYPPEEYLMPCVAEEFKGKTNADLLQDNLLVRQALIRCNSDKSAIRDWVSGAKRKLPGVTK
jgi:hypothetical protein